MHSLRHLILFFAGLLLVTTLAAESAAPAQPDRVTLRMLSFEGIISDLSLPTPQGRKRFVAMPTGLGGEITAVVADGGVNFYRFASPSPTPTTAAPNTTAAPPAPEQPVARFALQPGVTRYLVIAGATGQGTARTYQVYATADGPNSVPQGYARVINFTETPLAVHLGEGTQIVGASQTVVMQCATSTVQMVLKLARPSGPDGWDLMTSTSVTVPENRRLLLLIAPQRPRRQDTGGVVLAAPSAFDIKVLFDTPSPSPAPAFSKL